MTDPQKNSMFNTLKAMDKKSFQSTLLEMDTQERTSSQNIERFFETAKSMKGFSKASSAKESSKQILAKRVATPIAYDSLATKAQALKKNKALASKIAQNKVTVR